MRGRTAFPQTMEIFVHGMHRILLLLSGDRARVKAVHFEHAVVSPKEIYRRTFSGPVQFCCTGSGILLSATDRAHGIEGGDSQVHQLARAYLDLQSSLHATDVTSQVRRLDSTLLASGKAGRREIAELLHIHERTLI